MAPPIDPELARRIDEVLATAPASFVEHRRAQLEDASGEEFRRTSPDEVARWYDPEELPRMIEHWKELQDPYSELNLATDAFCRALSNGGTVIVSDIRTGDVVAGWEQNGSRTGSAPSN